MIVYLDKINWKLLDLKSKFVKATAYEVKVRKWISYLSAVNKEKMQQIAHNDWHSLQFISLTSQHLSEKKYKNNSITALKNEEGIHQEDTVRIYSKTYNREEEINCKLM